MKNNDMNNRMTTTIDKRTNEKVDMLRKYEWYFDTEQGGPERGRRSGRRGRLPLTLRRSAT